MDGSNEDMNDYLALVREFPLVSIRSDEHLDAAIVMLHQLLDFSARSKAQEEYLGALTDLIETYESAHVPIRQASGLDVVKHLMDANDLKQKDMSEFFGSKAKAITSLVLNGKRPIGLAAARRLSARFHLPLDVFLTSQPVSRRVSKVSKARETKPRATSGKQSLPARRKQPATPSAVSQ